MPPYAKHSPWLTLSQQNGGHCQPLLLEHPEDPSIPAFELANFHTLHRLTQTKAIDCEFVPQPGVRAIYSLSNLHATELALHTLQSTAPEMAKLTRITRDEDELARLRVPGALGAVITSLAARMWPYKLVARILEDLLTTSELPGGTFNLQTLTPVTSLTRAEPSSSSDGGWHVTTARGTIVADKVILSTNAYTSHLLPTLSDLIVPVRGQMSALHPLPSLSGENRLQTSFGFAGDGIDDYLIQRPNQRGGHLMFGGGRQCLPSVGETDDSVIDPETAKYLRRRLVDALGLPEKETLELERASRPTVVACKYCRMRKVSLHPFVQHRSRRLSQQSNTQPHSQIRCSGPRAPDNRCPTCVRFAQPTCSSFIHNPSPRLPTAIELTASHEWTGIMGFSRDELPWVGPVPASLLPSPTPPNSSAENTNLYLAAGFTGHGMPNTWLCGAAVARMARSGSVERGVEATGLPRAYLATEERVAKAREMESVQAGDWAEMGRGGRRVGEERPHSGYA